MFRYLLLGLLRSRGPLHGYALMKISRSHSGLMVGSGNFYRELQHLAREGLVARSATAGGDARRAPYEITSRGVAALEKWLAHPRPAAASPHHDELTMRALLIDLSADVAQRGLDQCRDDLLFVKRSLERTLAATRGALETPGALTRAMILGRCLRRIAVDLEFIEQLSACDAGVPMPSTEGRPAQQGLRVRTDRSNGTATAASRA